MRTEAAVAAIDVEHIVCSTYHTIVVGQCQSGQNQYDKDLT